MRIAYLGPEGTFSEDALREALGSVEAEAIATATIHDAIMAVERGEAERALVPVENSIEGSVRTTLDTLAFDADGVEIVGEHEQQISPNLIAREPLDLAEIEVVISHPQPLAQCERFLRNEVGQATVRTAPSTADAVREVAESDHPWAALGTSSAAAIYRCSILRRGVEDETGNVTRFVWVARAGIQPGGEGPWRTAFCFSELGADHPGALVDALTEFSSREVNLIRIESRPLRGRELGRYLFFCDLEGSLADEGVAAAIAGLRTKAERVRVLGSYPLQSVGVPGA